ncbi:hypothetical protein AEQU3_01347 [Aequorivita antarctica]|nr:hypothetical protein AEQU3_01347 [Aequorivita antarctica]
MGVPSHITSEEKWDYTSFLNNKDAECRCVVLMRTLDTSGMLTPAGAIVILFFHALI